MYSDLSHVKYIDAAVIHLCALLCKNYITIIMLQNGY